MWRRSHQHRLVVRRADAQRHVVFFAASIRGALRWIQQRPRDRKYWIEYEDQAAHRPRESIAYRASLRRLRQSAIE